MAWQVTITDDFNRANESPLAPPWDATSLDLSSNRLYSLSTLNGRAFYTGDATVYNQRQAVECQNGANYPAVGLRATDKDNGYMVYLYNGARFYKYVSGSKTQIGSTYGSASVGFIGLKADGTNIVFSQLSDVNPKPPDEWTAITSWTDATHSGGQPLLVGGARAGYGGDDFAAWDDAAATGGSLDRGTFRGVSRGVGRGV